MQDIGEQFQQKTKHVPGKLSGRFINWHIKPEAFKRYPDARRIDLPQPERSSGPGLWEVIQGRRSERSFRTVTLTLQEVSQLLWAGQGVTALSGPYYFRSAPSAGALYPIETYMIANAIEGLPSGLYHYDVRTHGLEQLNVGKLGPAAAQAALDQQMVSEAALVFIWSAVFARCKWKYDSRAYRYIYLDAGHIAENIALAAVALGLGSCQIAAFYDDLINNLIQVDGENESALYMTAVGRI